MTRRQLKQIIKEELLKEDPTSFNYNKSELDKAEKGHDWTYPIVVKFTGDKGSSKFLN